MRPKTSPPIVRLLRLDAASLLLAGCAATSDSSRFVLIESSSYGCGAAEGLGCGLAIAPVLGAMDELDGVAESSVSWDGRTFRIEVLPGADPERVATAAAALLEGESCCVTAPRGQAARRPDEWFNAEQTQELSRHEAGVIAADFAAEITSEVVLEAGQAERLHDVLREELELAFERAHSAGGVVPRLWEQLPQARAGFESRLDFLTPDQKALVTALLDRELQGG